MTEKFTREGLETFHGWTHVSLDALLEHLDTLPEELLGKELDEFGYRSIRAQLLHLFNCEAWWREMLQGRIFQDFQEEDFPDIDVAAFKRLKQRVMVDTRHYLEDSSEEELNREVELHLPDGYSLRTTPAKLVHHVLTHAYHHKGQVVAMCRLLGYPAPFTDLL